MKLLLGALRPTSIIMLLMVLAIFVFAYAQSLALEARGNASESYERQCVRNALRGSSPMWLVTSIHAVIGGFACVLLGFVVGKIAGAFGQPLAEQISTAKWVAGFFAILAAGNLGLLAIFGLLAGCFIT